LICQLQCGRIASQLVFIDELLLLLLKLQLCEAVRPGELSSCADRCHFVTLNDLVYLLRVRLVVM